MRKHEITTFEELFLHFIKHCKIKNVSPKTIIYYETSYNSICKFNPNIQLDEIDSLLIQDYILYLKQTNNLNSVNTRLKGLRTMLNYGYSINALPKIKVQLIRVDKEVKETYSTEQILTLIKKPNVKKCSFAEYRNWMIVHYLVSTGNRLSTLTNIKIGDLDIDNKLVTLRHTKNRHQQIIPLSSMLCKHLVEYLTYREGTSEDYLFPTVENKQLTKDTLITAIKNYNRSRGVNITSIHAFRRYFAKQCVLNGIDTFTLQKLGGWKDLTVVKNYIEIYATDIKDYDMINPLDTIYSEKIKNKTKR